ncbi:MAG: LytTR family DNA-binding domain-containing protein [Clostridiales bacterium]|nr:LytTR family DNA-binding domain-containing protein [Clostridiales bacterium]
MLRVAVAEDEQSYREQTEHYLNRYAETRSQPLEVVFFSSGVELLQSEDRGFDIMLLDIKMPDMDGMKVAELIRRYDEQVVIMFITQMAQFAIDGYSVGALDFLVKPVQYDTFALKFDRAVERAKNRTGGTVTLPLPGGLRRLNTRDIFYVEIQNHMLHYHTRSGEYVFRGTMQSAEAELTPYHFARCNHWYLVNLAHVSEVNRDVVTVAGSKLEISRRNKAAFMAAVTSYVGGNT